VNTKSNKSWQNMILLIIAALIVINFWDFSIKQVYPYNPPRIAADPYVAPVDCHVKKYKPGDKISESCADEKYIFLDYRRYGLHRFGRFNNMNGRKFGNYFRVGNDIVVIGYNSIDGSHVRNVERDVFIVNSVESDGIGQGKK
jgi:hypothetical protein